MHSSNDEHFDPKAQLLALTEEQAVEYAKNFVDQNCEVSDAAYLSEVITAGEKSPDVTYQHAINGSPVAQLVYETSKLNGAHTTQSTTEGLFWLLRSFNNGNIKAAIVLAGTCMQGEYVTTNLRRAFKYASFAADQGSPPGQFILANLLVGGDEIPEDQNKAIALLQVAARSGYALAIQMLEDNGIPVE